MYLGILPTSPWQHRQLWSGEGASAEFAQRIMDPAFHLELAQLCDRAGLDFLYLPDRSATFGSPFDPSAVESMFEPVTAMAYLAAGTRRIGLVPTVSTTWSEPYTVARELLSLDHLSAGRVGWNAKASYADPELPNFAHRGDFSPLEARERYMEFVPLVQKLWRSWDRDAVLADPAAGLWARPDSVHPVCHRGPHFEVEGPLNIAPSPQYHPLTVMAGRSDGFLRLAARDADVVFTSVASVEEATEVNSTLRGHLADHHRSAGAVRLMPGLTVGTSPHPGNSFHLSGRPADIAGQMAEIVEESGVDGFIVLPTLVPDDIRFFTTEVVPELRAAGVVPEVPLDADGGVRPGTLRANLGL
jgi:alkanesulfonate monooxygenase SsuD/methylene tetrahydromethanopterin reductase-like flavin-dependent oxidoreductase (luciferase family)